MTDIQWDSEASLMRVTRFNTSDPQEELIGRGVLHELVGSFLEMPADQQRDLLIRVAGDDWVREYDEAAIRELAARPEYTGAFGFFDTANLRDDPDGKEEIEALVTAEGSTPGVWEPGSDPDTGKGGSNRLDHGQRHDPDVDRR